MDSHPESEPQKFFTEELRFAQNLVDMLHPEKKISEKSVAAVTTALQLYEVALITYVAERKKILDAYRTATKKNETVYSSRMAIRLQNFKTDTEADFRDTDAAVKRVIDAATGAVGAELEGMRQVVGRLSGMYARDVQELERARGTMKELVAQDEAVIKALEDLPYLQEAQRDGTVETSKMREKKFGVRATEMSVAQALEVRKGREELETHVCNVNDDMSKVELGDKPVVLKIEGKRVEVRVVDREKAKVELKFVAENPKESVKIPKTMNTGVTIDLEIGGVEYNFTIDWNLNTLTYGKIQTGIFGKTRVELEQLFDKFDGRLKERSAKRDADLATIKKEAQEAQDGTEKTKSAALAEQEQALREAWSGVASAGHLYRSVVTEINGGLKQSEAQGAPIDAAESARRLGASVEAVAEPLREASKSRAAGENGVPEGGALIAALMNVSAPALVEAIPQEDAALLEKLRVMEHGAGTTIVAFKKQMQDEAERSVEAIKVAAQLYQAAKDAAKPEIPPKPAPTATEEGAALAATVRGTNGKANEQPAQAATTEAKGAPAGVGASGNGKVAAR